MQHLGSEQFFNPVGTGWRHGGYNNLLLGKLLQQSMDQRRGRHGLAYRDRMYPDRSSGTIESSGRSRERKAFSYALPIGWRFERADKQTEQNNGHGQSEQQTVKKSIHGANVYSMAAAVMLGNPDGCRYTFISLV